MCPSPSKNELVFVQAGQEDLEEKTFHYLSNSLFDLNDNEQQASEASSEAVVNPESESRTNLENQDEELARSFQLNVNQSRPRNKSGMVDEQYGLIRFGALFLDFFVKRPETDDSAETKTAVNSIYLIFYGIQINLSANLLHR